MDVDIYVCLAMRCNIRRRRARVIRTVTALLSLKAELFLSRSEDILLQQSLRDGARSCIHKVTVKFQCQLAFAAILWVKLL